MAQNKRSACWMLFWRRFGTETTTSFLDFSWMTNAQAAHEHTKHPSTQLGSVSFVDTLGHFRITFGLLFKLITLIPNNKIAHFQGPAFHNKNTMPHAGTKSSPPSHIECIYVTSRLLCWYPQLIFRELNSILMQTICFKHSLITWVITLYMLALISLVRLTHFIRAHVFLS